MGDSWTRMSEGSPVNHQMTSVKTSLEMEDNMIISVSESETHIIMCFQYPQRSCVSLSRSSQQYKINTRTPLGSRIGSVTTNLL
jgi:hypothetical protein